MPLQISMVLFRQQPTLSVTAIQEALASRRTTLPLPSNSSEDGGTVAFNLGDADVAIGLMPAPIPWSDLEGPCATSILWRDAASVVREHQYHAIVTVRGELSPIALSTLLTQVTAALAASSAECLGVFWINAVLLVPRGLFVDFATEVLPLGPPLPIWVDYRVGWNEDKTTSAGFTTGLAALGLMELEALSATEPPSELKRRFEAIAGYLAEHGLVIKDGHTVGESAEEKIRVAYSTSAFGAKDQVMNLSYESSVSTGKH